MNCKYCGEQNAEGAKFCNNCGKPLEQPEEPMNSAENQGGADAIASRNKVIAVVLGVVGALAVAVIVLILIMMKAGGSVEGKWYSPTLDQVMEFRKNNEVVVYTSMGAFLGTYTYDAKSGEGEIVFPSVIYDFVSGKDNITVYDANGVSALYMKMDDSLEAESMVGLQNETTEPPGANQNEAASEAPPTDSPTETAAPTDTPSTTSGPTAAPTNTPTPTPAATNTPTPTPIIIPTLIPIMTPTPMITLNLTFLPIPLYTIAPYSEIAGKWYSVSGEDGIFDFADAYRYSYDFNGGGVLFTTGDFTYDSASNLGYMHPDYTLLSIPFTYDSGTSRLTVQGVEYTRTYVPQS